MEDQNPRLNRRCQGDLIFTASHGRRVLSQNSTSPQKSAKKLRTSLQLQPSPPPQQQPADAFSWHSRRVSAPACELFEVQKPNSLATPSQFYSPSRSITPSKPPRSLNFTAESLVPHTPSTSQRKCPLPLSAKKIKQRAAMKLKALENERLEASRHEQDRSAILLEALEKAHGAWMNHVLLKPMLAKHSTTQSESDTSSITSNESRWSCSSDLSHISADSVLTLADKTSGLNFSVSPAGHKKPRSEKRNLHSMSSMGKQAREGLALDASFQAICSIPVLRSRLDSILDAKSREEVISVMIKVAKHIDDGRLRMKDGCAILTDVALKENLIQAMLNYNTPWLKIGLHVVLGLNALVVQETLESMPEDPNQFDAERETQQAVLRLLIEKHFLCHTGLAKYHATNKKIEGLYRQGYHEALARVILKRILLLVLTLDKAKCQSTLPLASGIDGIDGGSPILFHKNGKIKSSRHALQEFLLNSMHGEGDIVGHLGVLGYHVTHFQAGLADYSFEITNLIEDLKDGVRLCRLVQVLLADASILMKVKVPSDRPRRRSYNCSIALECLARAGVSVMDAFGCPIMADDLVEGDRERVLGLLWHIVVSLQIPALVNPQRLCEEITRISSHNLDLASTVDNDSSVINLLLMWIQVACMKFGLPVRNFTSSCADGQALCYLISYYYPDLLPQALIQGHKLRLVSSASPSSACEITSSGKSTELKEIAAHNLALFKCAISKLGSIPEVLEASYFIEDDPMVCEQSIIIMLAFLFSRLLEPSIKVEDKMAVLRWDAGWDFLFQLRKDSSASAGSNGPQDEFLENAAATTEGIIQDVAEQQKLDTQAAIVIQAAVRKWIVKRETSIMHASHACQMASCREQACLRIQRSWRLHSSRKLDQLKQSHFLVAVCKIQAWWRSYMQKQGLIEKKVAAVLIQSRFRSYRQARKYRILKEAVVKLQALFKGRCAQRQYWKYRCAAFTIQSLWRQALSRRLCLKGQHEAALKIQSHWHKLKEMRSYARTKNAAVHLQRSWRRLLASRLHMQKMVASTMLQSHWRKHSLRKSFLNKREAAILIQKHWRDIASKRAAKHKEEYALIIQSSWHRYTVRKSYVRTRLALVLIQRHVRGFLERKKYISCKNSVTKLQALVRGRYQRKKLHTIQQSIRLIQCCWRRCLTRKEAKRQHAKAQCAAMKIQVSWRRFSARRSYLALQAATVKIQGSIRRYMCRMRYNRLKKSVTRMQALVRRRLAWKKYMNMKEGVVKIQAFYRGRRQLRKYEACYMFITKLQAFIRGKRERKKFIQTKSAALIIQKHFRNHLHGAQLLKAKKILSAMRIQHSWRWMQLEKAATVIQAHYRGWRQKHLYLMQIQKIKWLQGKVRGNLLRRRLLLETAGRGPGSVQSHQVDTEQVCKLKSGVHEFSKEISQNSMEMLDWQMSSRLNEQQNAATTIQKYFRCWLASRGFTKARANIIRIQAIWRGSWIRHKHGHLKELSALRQRMQSTAANVDKKMRLEYRLTEALAALLSQKTVSGILHTCATIDLATQHSKLCCERLLEAGAIPKLLQLIQTTNRSPPHEEILKHSLSILGNLSRYPSFAFLVANAPGSLTIIAEQILRNNEEVLAKVLKLLQLICKVSNGPEAIRRNPVVMKRLNNLSQVLEKKVETEARTLARLPHSAIAARSSGEKKLSEAVAQHHCVVMILQKTTGEDLQKRLKAVKRSSSIHIPTTAVLPPRLSVVAPPRPSLGRFPLQDCSNN